MSDRVIVGAVQIRIPEYAEEDLLRSFSATIQMSGDDGEARDIGRVDGLIGFNAWLADVFDACDELSTEAATLGYAAGQIRDMLEAENNLEIDTFVLIEMIVLEPEMRGRRLTATVVDGIVDLLRLERLTTVIVLEPEPQQSGGGPMDDGPVRDAALAKLRQAYELSGFEQWRDTTVWWLPIDVAAIAD